MSFNRDWAPLSHPPLVENSLNFLVPIVSWHTKNLHPLCSPRFIIFILQMDFIFIEGLIEFLLLFDNNDFFLYGGGYCLVVVIRFFSPFLLINLNNISHVCSFILKLEGVNWYAKLLLLYLFDTAIGGSEIIFWN